MAMKNYAYELICRDHKGWGAVADGLWSADYACRADRLFATAREARTICREMRGAGCWDGDVPDFDVAKITVYEACWEDEDDVVDRLIDIHGGDIHFRDMPPHVAEFLLRRYGGAADAWARQSAALKGASSATYTAAFVAARYEHRCAQIRDMLASEGGAA